MKKKDSLPETKQLPSTPVISSIGDLFPELETVSITYEKLLERINEPIEYAERAYWIFVEEIKLKLFMSNLSYSNTTEISKSIKLIDEKAIDIGNAYSNAIQRLEGKQYHFRSKAHDRIKGYYEYVKKELFAKRESLKHQFDDIERYYPTLPTIKTAEQIQAIEPIKWIGQELLLTTFINYLQENGFIDRTILTTEIIEQHFSDNSSNDIKPIKWLKSESAILALFDALSIKKCISDEQYEFKPSLIEKHFVNKKGNHFKAKQLSTVNTLSYSKDLNKARNKTASKFSQVL